MVISVNINTGEKQVSGNAKGIEKIIAETLVDLYEQSKKEEN